MKYSLSILLILAMGCAADATKKLTLAEDATTGVSDTLQAAYGGGAITKADIKAVRPYVDASRDANLAAETAIQNNSPGMSISVDAATAAITTLEAQGVVKVAKQHAATQPTRTP